MTHEPSRFAVDMHRAGSALGDAAAELVPVIAEDIVDDRQQRHIIRSVVTEIFCR